MSNKYEFFLNGSNYKVDKRLKEYKRLKKLFPDCDVIFNLEERVPLVTDGTEYPSVIQFIVKDMDKELFMDGLVIRDMDGLIFNEQLDVEVYKLVNKLTDGKWGTCIHIICDDGEFTMSGEGKITDKSINWDVGTNEP